MAAIDEYLQQIMDAVYGEEVRGSIHDAIAAMNVESTAAEAAATSSQTSAAASASSAHVDAQRAEDAADRAEQYATGGVKYKGTIAFANVPTTGMQNGDMYNISDAFTADNKFRVEDRGKSCPAGTNIIFDGSINLWDIAGGTNIVINDMTGASASTAGTHGLVPAPSAGDQNKFLKGDGSWSPAPEATDMTGASASSSGTHGLVPAPAVGDQDKFLKGSGTWHTLPDMGGATATTAGSHGFVPAPAPGDNEHFLKGDGTWAAVQGGGSVVVDSEMSTSSTNPVQNRVITNALNQKYPYIANSKTGVKNYLKLYELKKLRNRKPYNVDYRLTGDGGISANGTNNSSEYSANYWIIGNNYNYSSAVEGVIPPGDYILTSGPNSIPYASANLGGLEYGEYDSNNQSYNFVTAYSDRYAVIHVTAGRRQVLLLRVSKNQTVNNIIFKPMIRRYDDPNADFQLGAKTNVELTTQDYLSAKWAEGKGYFGKNLLKNELTTTTVNGITFTVNANKSIRITGACTSNISLWMQAPFYLETGNYILSWGAINNNNSGFALQLYRRDDSSEFLDPHMYTYDGTCVSSITAGWYHTRIYIANGYTMDTTIYPMLRYATIMDDTYEPYMEPNVNRMTYKDNGKLGAKNLLPNKATTGTKNGVTFTVNSDGTVTANGTATADTTFHIVHQNNMDYSVFAGKTFILNGSPVIPASNTYKIECYLSSPESWIGDFGEGVVVNFPSVEPSSWNINITVRNGVTVNNVVFKPMLRLQTDTDPTYVPYAMTNRELTDTISKEIWSSPVTGVVGSTSVVFSDVSYSSSWAYEVFADDGTGESLSFDSVIVNNNVATVTFSNALVNNTTVRLHYFKL